MFVILEIQTFENGTIGTLIETADSWKKAQSVYHMKLASAAISGLPVHAVALLDNKGTPMGFQSYSADETQEEGT